MSELLDSLTKIETVANNISSSADSAKNDLSAKYKKMTLDFDSQLKDETQKKLASIKNLYESEMLEEQTTLHRKADDELMRLNKFYNDHKKNIVNKFIARITEVSDE